MFKALLFMGAGCLIHAVHSNNYTAMHGLRKYMPITHITFLIGCLAIAGIPPFSGFFSKDEILAACYERSPWIGAWMSMVAALTAFYMFRIYYLIFWWKEHKVEHGHTPHEAPAVMTWPLIFLAAVSCVAGFIPFGHFVTWNRISYDIHIDLGVACSSVGIAAVAIFLAWRMYCKENPLPDKMQSLMPRLWQWCHKRFYWDELYIFITHKIIFNLVCRPIAWFDRNIIDGTMDAFATITQKTSYAIRSLQSGQIQMYVWIYLIGALLLGCVTAICIF